MLLYGRRREFEYLVNFEPVDTRGSLSQMGIQIFIERECRAMYTVYTVYTVYIAGHAEHVGCLLSLLACSISLSI
jgi:hypothetical protein